MITRRPAAVLTCWLIAVLVAGAGAFTGFGDKPLIPRLQSESPTIPDSPSDEVYELTRLNTDQGAAITLVAQGVNLHDPAHVLTIRTLAAQARQELAGIAHVASVVDAFSFPTEDPQSQALLSKTADGFVIITRLEDHLDSATSAITETAVIERIHQFNTDLSAQIPGASALPLSAATLRTAILDQTGHDLIRGEAVGLPIALILMVLVFGGIIAAVLPLGGALSAIVVGMFGLWCLTYIQHVDSFILNVVSLIGLALSIDYGLLVVSRFREEAHQLLVARGYPGDGSALPDREEQKKLVREAVATTVTTAGRTVAFSALTIAFAVTGLLVMVSPILRTIGIGAMLVVVLAILTSVTLIPAVLTVIGYKLLSPSPMSKVPVLKQLFAKLGDVSSDEGIFSALARGVHRRPWTVLLGVFMILATFCIPISSLTPRSNFADYVPKNTPTHTAYFAVQNSYLALADPDITMIVDRPVSEMADTVTRLQSLDQVRYISQPKPLPSDSTRSVISLSLLTDDHVSPLATGAVEELRTWNPGYRVLVGGPAALQLDFNKSLVDRAPLAGAIMAAAVLILMFLMTGSVLIPLKALIINVLSLVASLGAAWFTFKHGLFGLPRTHGLDLFVVVIVLCFGFGLAMDYEVFLLARIKEYWDNGYSNDAAVEHGLQRSGRIITSAAAIIVAVFIGFVAGDHIAIKQNGVALAILIITDATLVRMLLVPATMTLLGTWNWWAPRWVQSLYQRFKIDH
ncbi:MAG: MMPL family transporter [Propionibacteriaceae bacterium]